MYRIIESIPSKNAEPIKQWLARLGCERIDEIFDSSITTQRAIDLYRIKGYYENLISKIMKGIQDRKRINRCLARRRNCRRKGISILTNEIHKEWLVLKYY